MELLVVLAVIVLLAGMLWPVLCGARSRATQLLCQANLRSIGQAAGTYAMDYNRALPWRVVEDSDVPFDTVLLRRENQQGDAELVNLGLLVGYLGQPEPFYCTGQTVERSPALAMSNGKGNSWRNASPKARAAVPTPVSGQETARGPVKLPEVNTNSSYPARPEEIDGQISWVLTNYANQVIFSDFLGVDGWEGRGRLADVGKVYAPHDSRGYNRLFGSGAVAWIDADAMGESSGRRASAPTSEELAESYRLLDVLP